MKMSGRREHGRLIVRTLRLLCISVFIGRPALAQKQFEFGGFLDASSVFYAKTPNPSDAYASGTAHFQLWSHAKLSDKVSWRGRVDFSIDTHNDVDRHEWLDVSQRGLRRPAGEISEFYLDMKLGPVDLRAGKQEIRWGRADGFNPTDNLLPYDYLDTLADNRLAVPAVKADAYFGKAQFEADWVPFYTPTRLPLLGQRWFPGLPASARAPVSPGTEPVDVALTYQDAGGPFPARTFGNGQWGMRWNQLMPRAEFSLSYFDGFDDLPFFRSSILAFEPVPRPQALISLSREYYRVRVAGADFASGIGPVGIRGELAYFDQTDPANLDHLLFIVGADRSWGDWSVVVQYAGQKVSGPVPKGPVFPDLGLRSTMLWRVERTLGPSRTFEIKGALRLLDGDFLIQPLYTVALANNWRFSVGATFFGGPEDGYLGQFRDNSHLTVQLRYTF